MVLSERLGRDAKEKEEDEKDASEEKKSDKAMPDEEAERFKKRDEERNSAFLDPQLLSCDQGPPAKALLHQPTTTSMAPHILQQPSSQSLPILLSTLLPLPRKDAAAAAASSSSSPVPPLSVTNGLVSAEDRRRVPIVPWPGVEAIIEAYKNYTRGKSLR